MIIGVIGFARTGKDTVSDILEPENFQRIAFADDLKRVVMRLFRFSWEQMWGSGEQKEAPDARYPREHVWNCSDSAVTNDQEPYCLCCAEEKGNPDREPCFLTPRYALKIIGTEGARHCWDDIWVERALEDAKRVTRGFHYTREHGAEPPISDRELRPMNVIITDCRFINEVNGIQKAGGAVYRIKRPGYDKPAFDHPSETEQLKIPDDRLNGVIYNDGNLEDLAHTVLLELGLHK